MDKLKKYHRKVSTCSLCFGKDAIMAPKPEPVDGPRRIFLLGEQPDRELALAGEALGITGTDPTIERLRMFLVKAQVDLSDVFYTSSVQCVPCDAESRARRPTSREVKHCTPHVGDLLEIVRPQLVIPLGHTAIQSIQWIYKDWRELRQFILNYDIGNVLERNGIAVYPLYHPSPGTLKARPESRQIRDWQRIPKILHTMESRAAAS